MTVTTVAVVGLTSTIFGNPVYAETVNDLQNKQTQVENDRAEVKEKLSKADAEIADILFDLQDLNEDIAKVDAALKENQEMLKKAKNDVTKTEEEIAELEEEIAELEDKIEARFDILKQRVTSYQKSGGSIGFLEVIFGSKNFGDLISRTSAVTKITNSDTDLIKEQEEDKAEVEKIQSKVEEKLAEQKEMKVELEGMEALIVEQQANNEETKKELEKKEKKLTTLKSNLENQDSSLAALESEIRRDIIRASTPVVSNSDSNDDNNLSVLSAGSEQSSTPTVVKGNGNINTAITAGNQHLGTPYRWAGKTPSGFDCSGFVSWSFGQAGISIPSNTAGLSGTGTKVSYSEIQPGDLVFFNTYKTNGHVGIYVGNGQFIGAQNSTGLAYADMTSGYWKDKFSGHVRRVR